MTAMDAEVAAELQRLRDSIDNMDAALVHLLAERFKITQQVGVLKAVHGLPPADPAREAQQIARLRALAEEAKLDPEFAEKFLTFVVAEVVRHHEAAQQRRGQRRASSLRSAGQSGGQGPAGGPAGEQAAAEERALQRAVAVHPAAAETGRLADRVHPGQRRGRRAASTRPSRSVSSPPRVLRVSTCSRTATSGAAVPARPAPGRFGVEHLVRRDDPDQPVAEEAAGPPRWPPPADPCPARCGPAGPAPRSAVGARSASIRCSPASSFILRRQLGDGAGGEEVHAAVQERRAPPGVGPGRSRPASSRRSLPVRSAFCSEPDRANSAATVALVQHEPGVAVAAGGDVPQRAERVEAREQRRGQPLTAGVQPQRRRPGQDPDAVPGPDRGVVDDPFRVVPHPVGVDQPAAGPLGRSPASEPST